MSSFIIIIIIIMNMVDHLLRSGRASITADSAVRTVLHSAEVVHFTHTRKQPVLIPRKSASGGSALLPQDLPDLWCSSYHRHPSSPGGQPWVALVPIRAPATAHVAKLCRPKRGSTIPNGDSWVYLNNPVGFQDYRRLPGQGSMPHITFPGMVISAKDHTVRQSQGRPIPANVVAR